MLGLLHRHASELARVGASSRGPQRDAPYWARVAKGGPPCAHTQAPRRAQQRPRAPLPRRGRCPPRLRRAVGPPAGACACAGGPPGRPRSRREGGSVGGEPKDGLAEIAGGSAREARQWSLFLPQARRPGAVSVMSSHQVSAADDFACGCPAVWSVPHARWLAPGVYAAALAPSHAWAAKLFYSLRVSVRRLERCLVGRINRLLGCLELALQLGQLRGTAAAERNLVLQPLVQQAAGNHTRRGGRGEERKRVSVSLRVETWDDGRGARRKGSTGAQQTSRGHRERVCLQQCTTHVPRRGRPCGSTGARPTSRRLRAGLSAAMHDPRSTPRAPRPTFHAAGAHAPATAQLRAERASAPEARAVPPCNQNKGRASARVAPGPKLDLCARTRACVRARASAPEDRPARGGG